MEWSGITFFPPGGLSSSVITSVWLGVVVSVFFNRRLGWSLSGLVVPGYLVPLVLLQPWSAGIIVFQGLTTYLIVRMLVNKGAQLGLWTEFFGRDRFFAILLVSVLVRISTDLWLLPQLLQHIEEWLGWVPAAHQQWQSFGLIIVALIANQMWKPGWKRGITVLGISLLTTLFLVRWVVIPLTNYHISSLIFLYEDVSGSILASPKAYIVLLTTAWIASRMNLRYGWDYNGILIPSLLALQWYQPGKIAVSVLEAVVILILGSAILRLPILQRADISGSRKILFFFTLSFIYKWVLGWSLFWGMPALKVSDYYGFGYLLPSLLALKMHDRKLSAPVLRATVQVVVVAVVIATAVGFGLSRIPNPFAAKLISEQAQKTSTAELASSTPGFEWLRQNSSSFYADPQNSGANLTPQQIEPFRVALRLLEDDMRAGKWESLQQANALLQECGYLLQKHPDGVLIITPEESAGWGTFVLRMHASTPMMLSLPFPREDWGLLESAWHLGSALDARAILISGINLQQRQDIRARTLTGTPEFEFASVFGGGSTLQVRAYTERLQRLLNIDSESISTRLYIKDQLPSKLDLRKLKDLTGGYELFWQRPPFSNAWRDIGGDGFAELILDYPSRRQLFYTRLLPDMEPTTERRQQSIVGYMRDWLLSNKNLIAAAGSNLYQKPTMGDLVLMEQEVLDPLLKLLPEALNTDNTWSEAGSRKLQDIHTTATVLGYELVRYQEQDTGSWYVILREDPEKQQRFWGTYVFRLQSDNPHIIQVPRPVYERQIFEFGVALFANTRAQALLLGGAHPDANTDGSADLIQEENRQNLFNLVTQAMLRRKDTPSTVVHCRAFGLRPDSNLPESDVLYSYAEGVWPGEQPPVHSRSLLQTLAEMELSTRQVSGQNNLRGYEVGGLPQARYVDQTSNNHFMLLWLSPLSRTSYAQQQELGQTSAEIRLCGLEPTSLALEEIASELSSGISSEKRNLIDRVRSSLLAYQRWGDVVALDHAISIASPLNPRIILDLNSKQYFLLLGPDASATKMYAIANLNPREPENVTYLNPGEVSKGRLKQEIQNFVSRRHSWLIAGERP